jgi:hypothetical protein
VTAADVRLAESVLQMQPGYLPMIRTATRCSAGASSAPRINGGQTRATENFFDGGAFGYASGHQQSQESAPPVGGDRGGHGRHHDLFGQYGHTSGGFIEYTSKSGTNKLHASAYTYLAKDSSTPRASSSCPRRRSTTRTGAYGGRTDHQEQDVLLRQQSTGPSSAPARWRAFGNTTPVDAFKAGDFSALLGPQIGTTCSVGPSCRARSSIPPRRASSTGFPCAIPIRATSSRNDPLRSKVAARYAALMAHPDRPGLSNNVAGQPGGRSDLGAGRARLPRPHRPPFSPKLKAIQRLLQQSPVGS